MLFWNHDGIRWSEFIKVSCEQWIVNALPSEIGINFKFSCVLTLKKKKVQGESCKLSFIWGKNEACSLGDSTSDGSESLLQRGGLRGMSGYTILVNEGGVQAIGH